MMGKRSLRNWSLVVAFTIVLAIVVVFVLRSDAPPLKISVNGSSAVVDVSTLGEYPTTVKRVRVSDINKHKVVWELDSQDSVPQVHEFRLSAGTNPVDVHADHGSFKVISPSTATFTLNRDTEYKLELWGTKSIFSKSTARFRFSS